MDLDAFVTVHASEWTRLDELSRRRRLTADEADELVELYRRATTHLSVLRSSTADAAVAGRLTMSVAQARAAVTGSGMPIRSEIARFVAVSFPAAVWRSRWWTAFSAALTLLVAAALGTWIAHDPAAFNSLGSDRMLREFAYVDFEKYYSEFSASGFAAQVWTNNAVVAALCVALGITGVGTLSTLLVNALNLGVAAGIMAHYDRLGLFFALITPHGLLELTAVFVAAGAGLHLFWSWIRPGRRPRGRALAEEGRAMITVALGLVGVLFVSGIVEAFVTPSPLPTWARIGIGALVWLAFLGYVTVLGRRAVRAGETGDVTADVAGDVGRTA
ncbi:MAG: stage II sporulation protein M [Kineosporiaceae bacterium]